MLEDLRVSLTKHGVLELINIIRRGQLVDYLNGQYRPARSMDQPQIKAVLGIPTYDPAQLPTYWNEIERSPEQIGMFCLVGIIFSHYELIQAFQNASSENMRGVLRRGQFDDVKVFTNIRGVLEASGAVNHNAFNRDDVPYDFTVLFSSGEVGLLVKQLLKDRLIKIGWVETPVGNQREYIRTFIEQCIFYNFHKVFSLTGSQFQSWIEGNDLLPETNSRIEWKENWEEQVTEVDTHLLVSLATKPFLILTGSSGTGKTYGVRQLANSLNPTTDASFNITFIAIEAGWKDGRHLVGFKNPFGNDGEIYQPTSLVNMLLKANSSMFQNIPFFILFDEMNLSHVEMYFAKFLALLETARHHGLHSEPLIHINDLILMLKYYHNNFEYTSYIQEAIGNGGLIIPPNVFFIGTVNIDETTYMFSPKVLDRAFVVEKNTALPSSVIGITAQSGIMTDMSIVNVNAFLLGSQFADYRNDLNGNEGYDTLIINGESFAIPTVVISFLDEVYRILSIFPFGHRIVTECLEYYLKANELTIYLGNTMPWFSEDNLLFDEMLMQKILPKLHGNRKQLTKTLEGIITFTQSGGNVRYPKTKAKLDAMKETLMTVGYCGFVC